MRTRCLEPSTVGSSVRPLCSLHYPGLLMSNHWLKYKVSCDVMYECTRNTRKSLKVIKITTFDQNQFMTCYLIFNFRPTYFSYFRKITVISISHNFKKLVDQKWSIPVVKGLIIQYTLIFQFEPYFIFVKYFRNKFL